MEHLLLLTPNSKAHLLTSCVCVAYLVLTRQLLLVPPPSLYFNVNAHVYEQFYIYATMKLIIITDAR